MVKFSVVSSLLAINRHTIMLKLLSVLSSVALALATMAPGDEPAKKVPYSLYTYHAFLQTTNPLWHKNICSGAIVSPTHIISTVNCARKAFQDGKGKLYVGVASQGKMKRFEVASIEEHPNFNPGSYGNDISVIKIKESFAPLSDIKPVKLPKHLEAIPMNKVGDSTGFAKGLGWNLIKPELTLYKLEIFPKKHCQSKFDKVLSPKLLCAGRAECQADEGAPLTYQGTLFGIASVHGSCPGLYTNIPDVVDFIKKNMKH